MLLTIVGPRGGIDVGLTLADVGNALVGTFPGGGVPIGQYHADDDSRWLLAHAPTDI